MPKNKVWTKEKLAEWKERQSVVNAEYDKAVKHQLEEWVKGNNHHHTADHILSVVNEAGEVVGYHLLTGGECCPDFSCCSNARHWPLELRQKFIELREAGDRKACSDMLHTALNDLVGNTAYVTGQDKDPVH